MKIPFKKTYYKTIKAANDLDVDREWAVSRRVAYLKDLLNAYKKFAFFKNNEVTEATLNKWSRDAYREIEYLEERKVKEQQSDDRITEDDIERAKAVPIDSIIEFRNRKAVAWCHDDKNPSLMHLTRINKAKCYPCQKHFSSIDAYMYLHGVGFIDAVKALR